MIREIMHDPIFLAQKSVPATKADVSIGGDMLETLTAHAHECVGMAANMIGVKKRIIIFDNNGAYMVMYNPEIVMKNGLFETEEGCLSLSGIRKTQRYKMIKVEWMDRNFKKQNAVFTGWTAQIIQHEIDHCNGVLI